MTAQPSQTPREWLLLEPAQEREEGRELLSVITGKVGLVRIVMSGAELNAATIRGDYAAVSKLLKSGVSPDFADMTHNGAQPLHRCA